MDWEDRIGRRLKLRDVNILLTVVQSGSMAKAAEVLAVSNPAVSKAISDLEHTLGVRLLERSPHGVEPTVYGHALLDRGVAAFDELKQAVKHIEFLMDPTAGEVRIGASIAMSAGFIAAVTDRLSRSHPKITFQVLSADFSDNLSRTPGTHGRSGHRAYLLAIRRRSHERGDSLSRASRRSCGRIKSACTPAQGRTCRFD